MKSLIWKELRENLKWVPLPGLVILLVFFIDKPDEPMLDATAGFFFALTAVAFGAALGFVQVFFEAHGDKRSILLHRPLSPSLIFLSKTLAGFGLYVLALGIPFLCLEMWYSTPGKMAAPYHWRTSLPWLADILSGLVYYFAGMLVAQRDVRWYGSRGLPLAAAFFCSYLVWAVPEFWQAVVAIVFFGSIMGIAAWGSFCVGGSYASLPRLAKTALAMTFLGGLMIVSILGKQYIGQWFDSGIEYDYMIDREGHALFQRSVPGVGVIARTDLNGRDVPEELTPKEGATLVWTETPHFWSYRNTGRFYLKCVNDTLPSQETWYYDQSQRRLLGYDSILHQGLGSFGPDGFTEPEQQPGQPFPEDLRYRCNPSRGLLLQYLAFPRAVYAVDFARRAIRTLFTPPAGETVAFMSRWSDPLDKNSTGLVVSTDQSLYFLTLEGAPVVSVPRLYDQPRSIPVLAGPLERPERYCVWYPSWFEWTTVLEPDEYRNLTAELYEYDLAGREIAHQTFPPIPYPQASYTRALFGLVTPMTEALTLVGARRHLRASARLQGGTQKPVLVHNLDNVKYYIPGTAPDKATPSGLVPAYVTLALLSATASALACFLLARRYAFSRARRVGWAIIGFLFGWVGLIVLLAVQEWPARVICPTCRKLRVVTHDRCEYCGAPHTAAAPDGTEIFESASKESLAFSATDLVRE